VFTVADYGVQLTADRPECSVNCTRYTSIPIHPSSHSIPHVPSSSFTSPHTLDIIQTGSSYSGTMQMARSGRFHLDEGLNSFSCSTRLELPPKSHNLDYCGPVSTHNRSNSVLPSFCHQSVSEPHPSWYDSRTPHAAVSHDRHLQRLKAPSFNCFTTEHCASAMPVARSHSHSPISIYSSEPSSSQSYATSVQGDISRGRRLQSPETQSSVNLLTGHRCRALSIPRTHTCSPASRYNEPSSSSSASDDAWGFRSSSGAVDQSASSRKRRHQQPADNSTSSSLLFAKKLAKLRSLRYSLNRYVLLCHIIGPQFWLSCQHQTW